MKKKITKFVAGLLILSFGLLCIPDSIKVAVAEELNTSDKVVEEKIDVPSDEFKNDFGKEHTPYILSEDFNLRNVYRKVYHLSDGTLLSQQYSTPIHFFSNGTYEEIDNSLTEGYNGENGYYENTANSFNVKFYKNAVLNENFFELSKDGFKAALEPVKSADIQKTIASDLLVAEDKDSISIANSARFEKAEINEVFGKKADVKQEFDYTSEKIYEPKFVPCGNSEIVYNNFWNNIALQYSIGSSEIEELILLNKKANDYSFVFKINSDELEVSLDETGNVSFCLPENGEVFGFSAPIMKDANGNTSAAVSYRTIESDGVHFIILTADSAWINQESTILPVQIKTTIHVKDNEDGFQKDRLEAQEKVKERENILRMKADTLPDYYTLTSASLKYHYEAADNSKLDVIKVPKKSAHVDLSEIYLPIEKAVSTKKKAKKIQTEITKIDIADIKGEEIAFGFSPSEQDETAFIYAEGERAAVLSLRYNLNVGLGPRAVTEQFGGDGIENYINVYTRQLTSVIDCMSVNSNILPIQLQMVYNPSYDSYKSNLLNLSDFAYPIEGMGKNFKLNLEQYCFAYEIDRYHDGFIYIDGSGAVHEFEENIRSSSSASHYVCKDCNLTCSKVDNHSVTIYKNNVPYMYFTYGRLKWIATPEKSLRIEYELLGGQKARISKVYNCLEGGTRNYPSSKEAQSVTFAYNSNNLLSSITSNYGETVSFTYNDEGLLTKVTRGSLALATIEYEGYCIETVFGKHKTGYRFFYSMDNAVYLVRAMKTDSTMNTAENAMFTVSPNTKTVEFSVSGRTSLKRQFAFDDGGILQSAHQGYCNQQDETQPRNKISVYNEGQENKVRTKTALSYTEDFSLLKNGSFKSITGNSPTNWTVSTTNTGHNFVTRYGGNLLYLTAKSSASQSYSFNNRLKTSYVLSFYAEAGWKDCSVKVTLSGKSISKTFAVNQNGQYYAFIAFDRGTTTNSGTLKFENLSAGDSISIDNVTLSPIDEYTESVWNGGTAYQTDKQITQETTYTVETGDDNRTKKETVIDHYTCNGTSTTNAATVTKTYTYTDATKEGETSKQEILSAIKYRENGTVKTDTQKVLNEINGTNTKTTTIYTGADGKTITTYAETDTNIYGYPLKQLCENGEKIYCVYGITQNNYRLLERINCNSLIYTAVDGSHTGHSDYTVNYTYNAYGECSRVSDGANTNSVTDYHNGGSALYGGSGKAWKTDTNEYGNITAVYENGNALKQIEYTYDGNQNLSRVSYNRTSTRMDYVDYEFDGYGNPTSEKWYDKNGSTSTNSATYTATYDYENAKQTVNSDGMSYAYQANVNGNPLQAKVSVSGNQYNATYTYSGRADGLLAGANYTVFGTSRTYTPQYNEKKQIISESDGSDFKSSYTYNAMGEVEQYSVTNGTKAIFTNTYSYANNTTSGTQYKTRRISGEKVAGSSDKYYGYDVQGRLTSITEYRSTTPDKYSYDEYNRLRYIEIGGYNGTWYSYTYDINNNLTQIGRRTPNGPPTTLPYLTFNYNAKNQLTSYTKEGTTKYYEYDNMGNPVKYGANSQSAADNFAWTQGTKLKTGTYKGNTFSYKYNADGLRYEKTVNGVTTRQYLEGDKIIAEEEVNANNTVVHTKYYIYDQTGIAGMVYDGTPYYFAKNMFGDVVSVHTETGAYAGGYKYDAWGNITSGGGSGIGAVNPFRYRGYYYDQETGFYYLQSRYYDPEICRFISADNLELIPSLSQVPGQLNLYAYCNNNPIMFTDPSGEIAITTAILIGLGVGAAVGLGVGLTYGLVTGARGWELAGYIILGASGGALLGGLIGAVIWSGAAAIQMLNSGFLYLAGGGGGTAGGALAVADVSVMVAGGVVVVGGVVIGGNVFFSTYNPGDWPGDDSTICPGDGFEWRGNGDIRSNKGNWYNQETGEILHPDLKHPDGIDPHWDYRNIFGNWFRVFKDGRFLPK